ncbi:MAG: L-histidine N(alpha)-methyltransferase [Gammaproteobacteria bacterium]|nr:L-histidine N(alpha)-methyltransferase [Gammaproteobacteria bacterium]
MSTPTELDTIIDGLLRREKMISPKYFYDEHGSQLFDQITHLPEYYPTETELGILQDNMDEIVELVGEHASLIEFGSGSSRKTRALLGSLNDLAAYVPVDISEDHLLESGARVQREFPDLEVLPVVADFTRTFSLPNPKFTPLKNVVYFPGSTIGNFTHDAAQDLLNVMYQEAGENGALLIGVDLRKDIAIIERAYDDSAGITAAFNLNMLRHLNEEFGFDFDLSCYTHNSHYNEAEGRIEMRLISSCDQIVTAGDAEILIGEGEAILTEYSHKYTLDGFQEMASSAGFAVERVWTDADALFSVQYFVRA